MTFCGLVRSAICDRQGPEEPEGKGVCITVTWALMDFDKIQLEGLRLKYAPNHVP